MKVKITNAVQTSDKVIVYVQFCKDDTIVATDRFMFNYDSKPEDIVDFIKDRSRKIEAAITVAKQLLRIYPEFEV